MNDILSAREETLRRIREPLGRRVEEDAHINADYGGIPRNYERSSIMGSEEKIALFIDRLVDYDVEVVHAREHEIAFAAQQILIRAQENTLVVARAFPQEWLPQAITVLRDEDLSPGELDHTQAVLTTCELGIAQTGTILLQHTGAQGRRAITLIPDHHLCIIRRDQVFTTVPEAFAALRDISAHPITTISGPSATSDIEMTRIRGVHGPRRLSVILV